MKKYLLLFLIAILFITCKKDNKVTPPANLLDVTGTWALYSWDSGSGAGGLNVSVTQYPCLADNILQINADFTTNTSYTGTDSCYVTPQRGKINVTTIGIPGQASYTNTWSRSGNNIYIGGKLSVISSSNGKLYLTATDTITQGVTSPLIIKTVDVKE